MQKVYLTASPDPTWFRTLARQGRSRWDPPHNGSTDNDAKPLLNGTYERAEYTEARPPGAARKRSPALRGCRRGGPPRLPGNTTGDSAASVASSTTAWSSPSVMECVSRPVICRADEVPDSGGLWR
jgi:hypothetical protein